MHMHMHIYIYIISSVSVLFSSQGRTQQCKINFLIHPIYKINAINPFTFELTENTSVLLLFYSLEHQMILLIKGKPPDKAKGLITPSEPITLLNNPNRDYLTPSSCHS